MDDLKTWDKTTVFGSNQLCGIFAGLLGSLANYVDSEQLRLVVRSMADDDELWAGLAVQSAHFRRLLAQSDAAPAKGAN